FLTGLAGPPSPATPGTPPASGGESPRPLNILGRGASPGNRGREEDGHGTSLAVPDRAERADPFLRAALRGASAAQIGRSHGNFAARQTAALGWGQRSDAPSPTRVGRWPRSCRDCPCGRLRRDSVDPELGSQVLFERGVGIGWPLPARV